ncbi:MAG TPA: hypothetical protein V6D08_12835 [Candidatus Obscuribacterales bacterium]
MKRQLVAVALILGTALGGLIAPDASAQPVIPGHVAKTRVDRLTGEIKWHDSLPDALAEARREGKLVFWVHMLGQIDGAT